MKTFGISILSLSTILLSGCATQVASYQPNKICSDQLKRVLHEDRLNTWANKNLIPTMLTIINRFLTEQGMPSLPNSTIDDKDETYKAISEKILKSSINDFDKCIGDVEIFQERWRSEELRTKLYGQRTADCNLELSFPDLVLDKTKTSGEYNVIATYVKKLEQGAESYPTFDKEGNTTKFTVQPFRVMDSGTGEYKIPDEHSPYYNRANVHLTARISIIPNSSCQLFPEIDQIQLISN